MSSKAASLVAGAKQWASLYGDYSNGEEGHALTAPLRVRAAWADNDAEAFANMFIDNGSALFGDTQLTSREQIRSYVAEVFDGPYKGSRLDERPREIRLLSKGVAVAVMEGGVLRAGQEDLAPADTIRTMYVLVKVDGDWRVASYQTSPVGG